MSLPPLRRRFVYPSNDLVTMQVSVDRLLDRMLAVRLPDRVQIARRIGYPKQAVAVLGFPRTGNTFLLSWLRRFQHDEALIIDGRQTHSALDVVRLTRQGVAVVIPVRHPVDACASMMVRQNLFADPGHGRDLLHAYEAWHRVVGSALESAELRVMPFDTVTTSPDALKPWVRLHALIDWDAAQNVSLDEFREQLRHELQHVPGQGADENGIPSRLMISLPDPRRRAESAKAKRLLLSEELTGPRHRATAAYAHFMERAQSEERVVTLTN